MNKTSGIKLIVWILFFEMIGFFLGLLTQANIYSWYEGLHKSILTPPGWVFSVVWLILYALLAIVGFTLSRPLIYTTPKIVAISLFSKIRSLNASINFLAVS